MKNCASSIYGWLAFLRENFELKHEDNTDTRDLNDGGVVRIVSPTNTEGPGPNGGDLIVCSS